MLNSRVHLWNAKGPLRNATIYLSHVTSGISTVSVLCLQALPVRSTSSRVWEAVMRRIKLVEN